jgi:hypothetical protein
VDTTEAFTRLTTTLTRKEIIGEASRILYKCDSPLTLFRETFGACGYVVRQKAFNLISPNTNREIVTALVGAVLDHFQIPRDYVPKVPLVREGLALAVQLRRVLAALPGDPSGDLAYIKVLLDKARDFPTPEAVFRLSYDEICEVSRHLHD